MYKCNIKAMRKRKGMTQTELASALGITQGAIQKLEAGINDLSLSMMEKISKVLECEPWELLSPDMQPKINHKDLELIKLLKALTNSTETTTSSTTKAG